MTARGKQFVRTEKGVVSSFRWLSILEFVFFVYLVMVSGRGSCRG